MTEDMKTWFEIYMLQNRYIGHLDNDRLEHLTIRRLGLPDRFIPHGPVRRLRADVGLNVSGIASALRKLLPVPAPADEKA